MLQAYNFDSQHYLQTVDESTLMGLSNIFSVTMFNLDTLHGVMTTADLLGSQFELVNEGCIFFDTHQAVTKLNQSARIMFNVDAEKAVGLQVAELLGT